MSDMPELLPCPFCGCGAYIYETSIDSDTQVQVQCKGCGAEIKYWLSWTAGAGLKTSAFMDVERRWNRRADTALGAEAMKRAAVGCAKYAPDAELAYDAISTLPSPSRADLLAAALRLPEVKALVEAMEEIACQKRTDELDTAYDVEVADFEGGYDECINRARSALAALKGADHG